VLQISDCPSAGVVVGLSLADVDLQGSLPSSLGQLPLQFLDVRNNRRLVGVLPSDLGRPSFWGLGVTGTRLNCHNNTLTDAEAEAFALKLGSTSEEDWLTFDWTPAERMCIDVLNQPKRPSWTVNHTVRGRYTCKAVFFPGSNAILSRDYILAYGCPCPEGTSKVIASSDGSVKHFCRGFQYMWIIETMISVLTVFYVCGALYRFAVKHQGVFVKWVKRWSLPGRLNIEGGVRTQLVF
jgi:hypothetical protein